MQLGIVSDTHGHTAFAQQAIRMLESLEVDTVLHCGDIGSPSIIPLFAAWPTHFVLGNVDDDGGRLSEIIREHGQTFHGRFGTIEISGHRIALLHGDDTQRLLQAANSGDFDLVCYGHTHRAEHHRVGTTLVLNPGALYRAQPRSLALVRLPEMEVTHVPL